jgi:hypothetical protein
MKGCTSEVAHRDTTSLSVSLFCGFWLERGEGRAYPASHRFRQRLLVFQWQFGDFALVLDSSVGDKWVFGENRSVSGGRHRELTPRHIRQ